MFGDISAVCVICRSNVVITDVTPAVEVPVKTRISKERFEYVPLFIAFCSELIRCSSHSCQTSEIFPIDGMMREKFVGFPLAISAKRFSSVLIKS